MTKRPRSGSQFMNQYGKLAVRQDHMWTPPQGNGGTGNTNHLKVSRKEREHERHRRRLEEWVHDIEINSGVLDFIDRISIDAEQRVFYVKELFYEAALEEYERYDARRLLLRLPFTGALRRNAIRDRLGKMPVSLSRGDIKEIKKIRSVSTDILLEGLEEEEMKLLELFHSLKEDKKKTRALSKEGLKEVYDTVKRVASMKDAVLYRAMGGDEEAATHVANYQQNTWKTMLEEYFKYGETVIGGDSLVSFDEVGRISGLDDETLGTYVWMGMIENYPKTALREFSEEGRTILRQVDTTNDPMDKRTFRAVDVVEFLRDTGVQIRKEGDAFVPVKKSEPADTSQ